MAQDVPKTGVGAALRVQFPAISNQHVFTVTTVMLPAMTAALVTLQQSAYETGSSTATAVNAKSCTLCGLSSVVLATRREARTAPCTRMLR